MRGSKVWRIAAIAMVFALIGFAVLFLLPTEARPERNDSELALVE